MVIFFNKKPTPLGTPLYTPLYRRPPPMDTPLYRRPPPMDTPLYTPLYIFSHRLQWNTAP
ncbi:ORF29 [Fowl aviadenovirus D]|uniref:ORF29 n=1 Tax=Fowl aviadenovirus D TaxID=190064 RepID=A0A291FDD0_9ADEN|nr:ORF29 [Fowl aviadenovirus D]